MPRLKVGQRCLDRRRLTNVRLGPGRLVFECLLETPVAATAANAGIEYPIPRNRCNAAIVERNASPKTEADPAHMARSGKQPDKVADAYLVYRLGRQIFNLKRRVRLP